MFLDWVGILLLTVPIFLPILKSLAFAGVFGMAGVTPDGHPAVVRRHLHGQHADGVPQSAVRLFAVLPEERRAAADQHGDDLPAGGAVHLPAGARQLRCASSSRRSSCGCRASSTRAIRGAHRPRIGLGCRAWSTAGKQGGQGAAAIDLSTRSSSRMRAISLRSAKASTQCVRRPSTPCTMPMDRARRPGAAVLAARAHLQRARAPR